jgi:hypothetical protein
MIIEIQNSTPGTFWNSAIIAGIPGERLEPAIRAILAPDRRIILTRIFTDEFSDLIVKAYPFIIISNIGTQRPIQPVFVLYLEDVRVSDWGSVEAK